MPATPWKPILRAAVRPCMAAASVLVLWAVSQSQLDPAAALPAVAAFAAVVAITDALHTNPLADNRTRLVSALLAGLVSAAGAMLLVPWQPAAQLAAAIWGGCVLMAAVTWAGLTSPTGHAWVQLALGRILPGFVCVQLSSFSVPSVLIGMSGAMGILIGLRLARRRQVLAVGER